MIKRKHRSTDSQIDQSVNLSVCVDVPRRINYEETISSSSAAADLWVDWPAQVSDYNCFF